MNRGIEGTVTLNLNLGTGHKPLLPTVLPGS